MGWLSDAAVLSLYLILSFCFHLTSVEPAGFSFHLLRADTYRCSNMSHVPVMTSFRPIEVALFCFYHGFVCFCFPRYLGASRRGWPLPGTQWTPPVPRWAENKTLASASARSERLCGKAIALPRLTGIVLITVQNNGEMEERWKYIFQCAVSQWPQWVRAPTWTTLIGNVWMLFHLPFFHLSISL